MNNDILIQEYKNAAELHGAGTLEGDSKKTNSAWEGINKIYLELKKANSLKDLSVLLDDPNSSVKGWAAVHLLPVSETESIKVLETIAKEKSLVGFDAVMTLKEWRAGKLKF